MLSSKSTLDKSLSDYDFPLASKFLLDLEFC